MSRALAMIARGRELGLDDAAILAMIEAAEAISEARPRSSNAERQARYRARKAERNACDVTSNVTQDVTSDVTAKKEIPPTPPKEKNYTHTQAGEPSDGQRYATAVRDVYAIAGQACPDLSPLVAWRKAGWPVEIVCEVIRAKLAANPSKNFTLRYFENAVADAVARSNAPVPIGSANQRAGPSAPREKPMTAAASILQRHRETAANERHYAETQPVVIDALPIASGAR